MNGLRIRTLALGAALVLGGTALGGTMIPLPIDQLARHSQWIVHGTVTSKSCQRDPEGRIYTKVDLEVIEIWKGGFSAKSLTLVHGGGTLGEERVVAIGQVEYGLGEEVVAFLVLNQRGEAVTLGMAQGKFRVWQEQAGGPKYVLNPFHGRGDAGGVRLQNAASNAFGPLTLSELKARVAGGRQ